MTQNDSRYLLAHRIPFADESLEGFVSRLCEANRILVLRWLLDELNGGTYGPLKKMLDIVTDGDALEKLENIADLPSGTLRDRALVLGFAAKGRLLKTDDFEWPIGAIAFDQQQLCPDCLRDAPYHRKAWRFIHAPVCAHHKRMLIDRCPSCDKPISGSRTDICHCHSCLTDFREAQGAVIADSLAEFGHLLQHPQMLLLGTATYTESLTPEDLFQLWRLADLPEPGEALAIKATYQSGTLPLHRRVRALARLTEAWNGQRIESPVFRALLHGRWNHLKAIPSAGLIPGQLAAACRSVWLDPEIAHVLLHDEPGGTLSDALMAYGPRLPRLQSPLEVAHFLGVQVEMVETSFIGAKLLTLPDEGDGFDADELFEVQSLLASMLTEDQVDQAVGFKGGAEQLEKLGLLRRWGSYADSIKRYPEGDLAALFDRVSENLSTGNTSEHAKSINESVQVDTDYSDIAYLIALAVNRGIELHGWKYPYRLIDIHVDPECDLPLAMNLRHS